MVNTLCICSFLVSIALATLVVLPQSDIYSSYRHRSLSKFLSKINTGWLLILGLLLLATYFNKSTSSFSRIATSTWAICGWLWLVASHILGRQLLRIHRSNGGNSRSIVYWGLPDAAESLQGRFEHHGWATKFLHGFAQYLSRLSPQSIHYLPAVVEYKILKIGLN